MCSFGQYTCYDGDFLCPVLEGKPTLQCGPDCYLPEMYSCDQGKLRYPPGTSGETASCSQDAVTQQLSDPPYQNYFYSDCHSATQVVVTSPLESSNLTIIGPRLLVAWPAGNSGAVAFFKPSNGINGTLEIRLENGTGESQPLRGVYEEPDPTSLSGHPTVGVSTLFDLNSSAVLAVPILGSIRNIRDFTEGPSLLYPIIQDAINFTEIGGGGVRLSRLWLDNVTTTSISFIPVNGAGIVISNRTLEMDVGTYNFTATFDYPQLEQLSTTKVLNEQSQNLITEDAAQVVSLEFLSYTQKLLAGAWRFLTYFGRDSMIATLLLQPVLSGGAGGAIEAVIGAVLERLNRTTGIVCHEETIGDYATYLNLQKNISSTSPGCTYQMVDTDYYLAPLMENYFLHTETGRQRTQSFLSTTSILDFGNAGLTYYDLTLLNTEAIMNRTAAFASPGGQSKSNLIHLEEGELVGEWRDSTYGIGGGRIPYDVNTALVPASLRSISALASAGWFQDQHPEWSTLAMEYAQIWESETLKFFEVTIPAEEAKDLVENYTQTAGYGFPSHSEVITDDIKFYGLALDGNNDQEIVRVMNTDDCFQLFFLTSMNTTNQTQLTSFLNQTAKHIIAPFPVGLSTDVGLLIANPAYGNNPIYAANWTNNAYHGTVVWSWQLAMMAKGLERQLSSCSSNSPDFCGDNVVYGMVKKAYNHLWDIIEANSQNLNSEVWSWRYDENDGFSFVPLGALPPPKGLNPTESNVRQLWSLTFISVKRDEGLR
ncbi:hypothetical protein HII31_12333 [Pseudocercospora fuligena]|uniref:Endo-1,3(4)-beta-glucanase 1 carbohydrate binding domain-containing protein n=1 Tax=Pseudocercospora fuligena TaxID=685502 RepID=A0A8H6R840_9PEZI|nr:hypothetical protein HII31_12333 [Pseudocercospora fuligena]